ncbi:MAG: MFS transporter [Pseudomonadota bacterium]
MLSVITSAWSLLLGMGLLMVGNGMQGTLLGIRGEIEDFSTLEMSIVMSAYFVGFLGGSRMAPRMIARVGHVRVFAALASLISAVMILYPTFADPWVWTAGRVLIGFCFSAVYVVAESWLNDAATNENRGQALSLYMIVQTSGIVAAQALMLSADPSGYVLFVIPSILVSLAVTPILLSISPVPAFDTTKPMSLRTLYSFSPLGCVGMFLLGGVFAAQFGMSSVYAAQIGLSVAQVSSFVAMFFVGAIVLQYPIGWLSDRMGRRVLITSVSIAGVAASAGGVMFGDTFTALLLAAFAVGGLSNPLYSLLLAHTNDFLEHDDMAAASGGLIFINGLGAIAGPLIVGALMDSIGSAGFWAFIGGLFTFLAAYSLWRATQRDAPSAEDTGAFVSVALTSTPLVMEYAQEIAIESDLADEDPDQAA